MINNEMRTDRIQSDAYCSSPPSSSFSLLVSSSSYRFCRHECDESLVGRRTHIRATTRTAGATTTPPKRRARKQKEGERNKESHC